MRTKLTVPVLAAMLSVLLTGCFSWSVEESYKLPQPPQAYQNLTNAVNQTKRALASEYSATVEDVPPSAGDNTSTVQLLDMDGDGSQETAVSFFRILGAENPIRLYFYTLQDQDGYVVSSVVEGAGDGVYAVHYADVDGRTDAQGRQCKEVVVSWQMGNDAYYLGVYSLDDADEQMLMSTTYDDYRLLDMDGDDRMELAVAYLGPDQPGQVVLYDWQEEREPVQQHVPLSAGLSSVRQMRTGVLADKAPALYISGDLTDGRRVTDVVAMDKRGELSNLSMDGESGVSREVCDAYRELPPTDVNDDDLDEVARPRQLTSYANTVGAWLNDWVQYSNNGRAKTVCTTYHNTVDGWYLVIPQHWQSRLIITRNDTAVTGQRAVNFSLWQGEDKDPLTFLTVYKLTGASRSLRAASANRFVLAEDGSAVYAAAFHSGWDCGLDQSGLLDNFRLIVSSWSGE